MPGCSAPKCINRSERGYRAFRFPSNPARRNLWVDKVNRLNWVPTKSSYLCEAHFEETQFELYRADGFRKLRPDAVPTLFGKIKRPRPLPKNVLSVQNEKEISESGQCQIIPKFNPVEHTYSKLSLAVPKESGEAEHGGIDVPDFDDSQQPLLPIYTIGEPASLGNTYASETYFTIVRTEGDHRIENGSEVFTIVCDSKEFDELFEIQPANDEEPPWVPESSYDDNVDESSEFKLVKLDKLDDASEDDRSDCDALSSRSPDPDLRELLENSEKKISKQSLKNRRLNVKLKSERRKSKELEKRNLSLRKKMQQMVKTLNEYKVKSSNKRCGNKTHVKVESI